MDLMSTTEDVPSMGDKGLEECRGASGSRTPIQSLPNEIWANIFEAGASMCTVLLEKLQFPLPFPLLVSSVSRKWRAIALSSPPIWTTIVIDCNWSPYSSFPSLWLSRSGTRLLDITILLSRASARNSIAAQAAMDRVIPHAHRWRRFTMNPLPLNILDTAVACLRTISAPYLRHFDMAVWDRESGDEELTVHHLLIGGAASLASARIIGHLCTPPLAGLTFLQLGGFCRRDTDDYYVQFTSDALRGILTETPSLTHLALQCLDIEFPSNTSVSDIQIPSLRILSVNFSSCGQDVSRLFSILSLPNLETLNVARLQFAIDTGVQRYTALRTLKLFELGNIDRLLADSLALSFPSITHLYLIETAGSIMEPTQHHSDLAINWPDLKIVTISAPETIANNFIDARIEMGRPLETVYVPRNCAPENIGVRQETEVLEVDNNSETLQYPGGLVESDSESEDDYDSDYESTESEDSMDEYYSVWLRR